MEDDELEITIKLKERKLLEAQLDFMLYWATLFFHEEHRAVMAFLCYKKLDGVEKVTSQANQPEVSFWRTKNIDNIMVELKNGFMVNLDTKKIEKEEVKFAWVNLEFFTNYPNLRRVIAEAIKPEYEEIKKFSQNETRKRCETCGTIRVSSEVDFFSKGACECANPKFVIM